MKKTAAVIGGGPAGLMAAERLARAGAAVTIYDQMPSLGRKFLMAGRGGLNLTHSEPPAEFLSRYDTDRGGQTALGPLIRKFPPDDLVAWANQLGQETFVGSSGRVFPKVMKASPLLRAWLARLAKLGVEVHPRHKWVGWAPDGRIKFVVAGKPDVLIAPEVCVLALGGATWPRLGSDAQWTALLDAEKVPRAPFVPSNSGVLVNWSDLFKERFAGEPFKRIIVTCGDDTAEGEAMVTRDGLEGGVIYALSAPIRRALEAGGVATLHVDLRPSFTLPQLCTRLSAPRGKQSTSNFLRKAGGLAPVATALLREGGAGALPADPKEVAALIKACPVQVTGLGNIERAISSAGGIKWRSINEHMMLYAKPGVFIAGEMLDWDAPTGGYLLQATFATSVAASDGARRWLGLPG
jgi:uncharacterized flavoprotein (TIGR03862 family)